MKIDLFQQLPTHLHQDGVLSLGGLEGQLVEGENFTTGLENAFAGARGHVHGAERQLGDLVQTKIVGDRANDDGGLAIAAWREKWTNSDQLFTN